jgi:iron complex transport system ATP-binding protein
MAERLVEIENATVYRGDTRVFDGLSLSIDSGVSTAVLGPNGAGKTTLLQLIAHEQHPVVLPESFVRVLGRSSWNVLELRSELGLISHELSITYLREVSGLDAVVSGFHSSIGLWEHQDVNREQIDAAREIMRRLGISRLEQRSMRAMSAGEQRRCLLGRALVHHPHTLLFDEPTNSLDVKSAFEMLAEMRGLSRGGKTLVIVTHHVHEIPPEVSAVVLLKQGRVFASGPKRELLRNDTVSALFDTPLEVIEHGGFYQVYPRS